MSEAEQNTKHHIPPQQHLTPFLQTSTLQFEKRFHSPPHPPGSGSQSNITEVSVVPLASRKLTHSAFLSSIPQLSFPSSEREAEIEREPEREGGSILLSIPRGKPILLA